MLQLPPIPPPVNFALFGAKFVEVITLLTRGLARWKVHKDRCELIAAAYQDDLKWLKRIALLRPRLMIYTAVGLAIITIWFFLIIYSYYSPYSGLAQKINATYPYSMGVSATALFIGFVIIILTLFSFARIYDLLGLILPQPEQRLASRVDRDTDGYFYINEERSERIAAILVDYTLNNPSWYSEALVYTPTSSDEIASARYANFVFFGELVEAKAAEGKWSDRWEWITEVYKKKPTLFEPAELKRLTEQQRFASTMVDEMAAYSRTREPFGEGLIGVLNFDVAMLGKRFKYDARNIARPKLLDWITLKAKLRSKFQLVDRHLVAFEPYKKRSGNRFVLIKLLATRGVWDIPLEEFQFPFAAWQCVFLLRSRIISTDLEKFSSRDDDFAWFRNTALSKLSISVKNAIDLRTEQEREAIKNTLKLEIRPATAMLLTDTFLWKVGTDCCVDKKCVPTAEGDWRCPFTGLKICTPEEGKKFFTYEAPNFVLK